jgi:hypothetical protein
MAKLYTFSIRHDAGAASKSGRHARRRSRALDVAHRCSGTVASRHDPGAAHARSRGKDDPCRGAPAFGEHRGAPEHLSGRGPSPACAGVVVRHDLTIQIAGGELSKSCTSQATKDANFICLVLWVQDLVRNIERGIETFTEAFYNEGARALALRSGAYDGLRVNTYDGDATREDSFNRLDGALARLDLTRNDVKLTWDDIANEAHLRLRLRSGRIVAKTSRRQVSVDSNIHVLALWLQTKAKNFERGLEPDLETLFAANLLPA